MSGYSEFVYCEITLALRATPATTKTFYFSNRVVENDSVPFKYQPLLKSYNVGAGISGYTPKDTFGSVILDNEYSSHKEQFRFSDYLEEYEIIGQEIKFYSAYNEDVTGNDTLFWTDLVSSYSYNTSNKTLSLTLKSSVLPKDIITYVVDNSWVSGFSGSLGKPLPFVIGQDVQVKPVLMRGWQYQQDFGYATTLSDSFTVNGVQKYLAKDIDDRYKEVKSIDQTTAFYEWANDSSGGYVQLHDGEMASRINYDSANPYIATRLVVRVEGHSGNTGLTIAGEIVARIYKRRDDTGKPTYEALEEIRINKTDYPAATWNSTTEFLLRFEFTKPLVMTHESGYFVSLQCTESSAGGTLRACTRDETGRVIQFRNDSSRNNLDSWQAGTVTSGTTQETAHTFIMHFLGVEFTDWALTFPGLYVNNLGLSPAFFKAEADPIEALNFPSDDKFDLADLDLIVEVDGIRDNSLGTITGVANNLMTDAVSILKLLSYEWSGTSWASSGKWDGTTHIGTHGETNQSITPNYLRVLTGKTSGITRKNNLISDIARNMQCLITQNGIRQYSAFFIGTSSTASQTIYANECKTISFSATDQNAIITRALMFYNRKVEDENKGLTLFDQQQRNYGAFLLYTHDDGGTGQTLLADSYDLYGNREMQNTDFNWIDNATYAGNVLNILLRRHDMPHMFVTFDVPRVKNEDGSVTPMALGTVFNLKTPELPSNDGTTMYNNFNPAGETNTQNNHRADSYKCQLVQFSVIKNENEMTYIRHVARVILSSQDVT